MGESSERNTAGEDVAVETPLPNPSHGDDDGSAQTRPSAPPVLSPAHGQAHGGQRAGIAASTSGPSHTSPPAGALSAVASVAAGVALPPEPAAPVTRRAVPPPQLRVWRLLTGLIVLVLAWAALTAAFLLAQNVWASASAHPHPLPRVLLYGVEVLAALWLGVAGIACVVTGAFCLMLALTRRGW